MSGDAAVFGHVPTSVLQSELARRSAQTQSQPPCGSRTARGSYNTALHVWALVIILALSTFGTSREVGRVKS